jgi:6-phosphogluconolactonase (cycloisomerase 2 family)
VANSHSNNVSAFSVNQTSGALSGVAGAPFTAGSAPSSVAVDPTQGIVYVANSTSNTVSVFAMNQGSGALSPLNDPQVNLPFTTGTSPISLAVVPTGGCILAANNGSNNVSAFWANAVGNFGCGSYGPFAAGPGPSSVAIDPSGKFAYVTNSSSDYISQYRIAVPVNDFTPDNALTPISNPAAGSGPASVTVDPTGRFAYAANSGSNNVSAFSIDPFNGVLIPVSGSPYAAGTAPSSVAVDSSGKFVYVTNASSNNISVYSINQSTGALSAISGSPFATGSGPVSIAISEVVQ